MTDELLADEVMNELAGCETPWLIGVRHHSAAMAKAMPALLDAFQPEHILLELPPEFAEWLPWLSHEETVAPVALAGCRKNGADMAFYPFADFSPELAAIRWAARQGVTVEPFDLPLADRSHAFERDEPTQQRGLLARLMHKTQSRQPGQLWERLIESAAATATPEQIRRAGLLFGWALRWNDGLASGYDRRRENFMRERIAAAAGKRCAAIIGAYHAAALLPAPRLWESPDPSPAGAAPDADQLATAMIPYSFEQLDERSGYPAGIRDPLWHQRALEAADVAGLDAAMVDLVVAICRELRGEGHPMNAADGIEVVRMARDLARLRHLGAAGRSELIEALQTCLTRGELYGIGRAVASAMQCVLVGSRFGKTPGEMPRCGLAPHIEELLQRLRLPGPSELGEEKRMRLDPLRSRLDRARVITFERLNVCRIPYAEKVEDGGFGDRESLTSVWNIQWQHSTAATIALSAAKGATLEQAAAGTLRAAGLDQPLTEWSGAQLEPIILAAHCGFIDVVNLGLAWLTGPFAQTASLAELTRGMHFVDKVRSGHIPGLQLTPEDILPGPEEPFAIPPGLTNAALLEAAISRVEGLVGSEDENDVSALLDLVLWYQQQSEGDVPVDAGRLLWAIRRLRAEGSDLMRGTGLAALYLLDQISSAEFQEETGSWVLNAVREEARRALLHRLRGCLPVALPRLQSDPECLDGIDRQMDALEDREFLERLPSLRHGFQSLSPRTRRELLKQWQDRLPASQAATTNAAVSLDPEEQQLWFEADQAARAAVAALMPDLELTTDLSKLVDGDNESHTLRLSVADRQLPQLDRWRLILGVKGEGMCQQARAAARALDELYGQGAGEGGKGDLAGNRGGSEAPYPNVRTWSEELENLFGDRVREEVLAVAVEKGWAAALTEINEESVRPSVELLEQVLSMRGALPADQTEKLRRIAKKITEELAKELATRMAPSLVGLSTPRPTRRPTPRLDLRRTVLANLHTVRFNEAGEPRIAPEEFFFKTPARRSMDWHLIYVVDVSGSMEASVIYSALTAAIFSGLPALSVSFLAFSTEVIDFTEKVADPLEMLLEVQVGGGTYIYRGLQAARELLRVPSRTIVLLITDFEEGGPVPKLLSEVRSLVDSGANALGLAALSDDGKPRYHAGIAAQVAACGMPVAALSPQELARWVGEQVR